MKSFRTERCHVGLSREFVGTACCTYGQSNTTNALTTCSRGQALINMNIEENFEASLWRHRWRHHHEIFFGIIWDDFFISDIKWKVCLIFQNFRDGRHFELWTNFLTGSYTGSWIYQKDRHEHFGHFELLIDALAQILTEIYQFKNLTYFVTWWRYQWRHEYVFT